MDLIRNSLPRPPQPLFKWLTFHLHDHTPVQIFAILAPRVLLQELGIAGIGLQLRPCGPVLAFLFENDAFLVEREILFRGLHSLKPFFNFMIVYFLQPLLCDLDIFFGYL